MSDNIPYLKSSDFAQFCGVTKNTLFHYEKMGLLEPEIRTKNGYRYYTLNQVFTTGIISVLKAAGSPLKEIKTYIDNFDNNNYITLLSDRHRILEKELAGIKHMKDVLENTISITERAVNEISIEPAIEEHEEQYLLIENLSTEENLKEQMYKVARHYKYCLDEGFSKSLIIGFIKSKATIESGRFDDADSCFCEVDSDFKGEMLYIKPKGRYVALYHQGSYATLSQTYEKLLDYVRKENLTVAGNAYDYELVGYLSIKDKEKFLIKVVIEIE